jgi:alginate export protein
MKPTTTVGILATGALLAHGAEVTEAQRKTIEQKMAGTYNPLSFYDGALVFDVQERLRVELRDNNFDFNDSVNVPTDDAWILNRFRLGAMVKPVDWFKVYAQGQDTREFESERKNVPFVAGSEGDDPFDLRQGYVELGNPAKFPLVAKVGRQELIYGDERLIGAFDWNNFTRTFDAVKLRYDAPEQKFWVDAFASHVVEIRQHGPGENRGWTFNDANWRDTFAGIYGSTTLVPKQTTDLYFLYRNKKNNDPLYQDSLGNTARPYDIKQEVYTVGARVKSLPGTLNGFDYEAEGAYQFGRDQGRIGLTYPNALGVSLDHEAFAFEARLGYTWEDLKWKPRLGVEYSFASGDTDPNDDKDESFLNLFPTNHKFYGYMDLFAWKNIHNPVASLKFAPDPKVTVQLDGHGFWLVTNEDAWYRANAVAQVRPFSPAAADANTFVGTEFDLTVGYTVHRALKFLAGYSHFFAGPYLEDTGAADDADFGYLQMLIAF